MAEGDREAIRSDDAVVSAVEVRVLKGLFAELRWLDADMAPGDRAARIAWTPMNPGDRPRSASVLWNIVVCFRSPVSILVRKTV